MKFCKNLLEKVIVGVLFGVGFIWPTLWFFGLLAGSWYLYRLLANRYSLFDSYLVWLIKSAILTSWVWAVYPIDWIEIPLGVFERPLIGFYWITVAIALATGGLVFHGQIWAWQHSSFKKHILLVTPFFLLLAELAGSFFFSVLMHGPGGTVGVNFSMGYVGYLLAQHQWLVWFAHVAGVYGLTIIFGGLIVIGAYLFQHRQYLLIVIGILLLLAINFIPLRVTTDSTQYYEVVHIDTYFNAPDLQTKEQAAEVRAKLAEAITAAEAINPDYIILPEDTNLFQQEATQNNLYATLQFLYGDIDAVVVDSGQVAFGDKEVLQVAIYDGMNDSLYQSHKRYLVPQGEYMPNLYRFVLGLFDRDDVTELLNDRLDLVIGPDSSQADYADNLPGVLFCFEVVDPIGVRTILNERSGKVPFIAHIVSHSFINESRVFRQQLETMLAVQAIWNDVYIVVAGNELPGFTVTPEGRLWQSEIVTEGDRWAIGRVQIPVR